jgi:uncharacterized coiled-coil DUF342 family protein
LKYQVRDIDDAFDALRACVDDEVEEANVERDNLKEQADDMEEQYHESQEMLEVVEAELRNANDRIGELLEEISYLKRLTKSQSVVYYN